MNIGLGIGIPFNRSQIWLSLFDPSKLFTAGVNGAWYDPSDLTTLYRDAAGTLPVTAVEQPVGLMLDKSKGLVLGPELVTNGDFSSSAGWNTGVGWTINAGIASRNVGSYSVLAYTLPSALNPGRWYQIEFDKIGGSNSAMLPSLRGGATVLGPSLTATNTRVKCVLLATAAHTSIGIEPAGSANDGSIDNISVRELPGNHAFNSSGNSANFPVLSARYNLLTKTEDLVDTVWSKDSANTVPTSLGNGVTRIQFLSGGTSHRINQPVIVNVPANTSITLSCKIKSSDAGNVGKEVVFRSQNNAPVAIIGQTITLTSTYQTVKLSVVIVDTRGNLDFRFIDFGLTNPATDFTVKELQLIFTNDALNKPDYQRVNTATDYDTVGFPKYLKFNGVNQWLQTNSIDFSYGDKMFVSAGVRKLSDASVGVVTELSVSAGGGTSGTFMLHGQTSPVGYRYAAGSGASGAAFATDNASVFTAPITNVVSGISDFAGVTIADEISVRVNGAAPTQTRAGTVSTGNFGNYPLYIGARGGSSLWFNGNLYQLVISGKQASDAEITATETFINQKTGAY